MGSVATNVEIMIGGQLVPLERFQSYVVDRDMNQPDMASVVLSNEDGRYSNTKIGAPFEIKVGAPTKTSIYIGEVVGLEPVYKLKAKTVVVIRAMNKLHRL